MLSGFKVNVYISIIHTKATQNRFLQHKNLIKSKVGEEN